jgi:hypothetical protein
VLEAARSRDDALDAIVAAAMVLSPRVGLFRARGEELVGLSTPKSALDDLGGKIVAATEGSAAGIAASRGRYSGLAPEADLRLATGASATTPCLLQRVDVRGKPVVFVYLDRDGASIDAQDVEWLGDLAALGGRVFEDILKQRRQPGAAPTPPPRAPTVPAVAERLGVGPAGGWGPVPPRVRAAYGEGSHDEPIEPPPVEPPPSRVSTPEREHPDGRVPPPSLVTPPMPEAEPAAWRLTPELAARALDGPRSPESASREPAANDRPTPREPTLAEASEAAIPKPVATPEPEAESPQAETPEPEPEAPETPEPEPSEPETPEPETPEPGVPEPSEPEPPARPGPEIPGPSEEPPSVPEPSVPEPYFPEPPPELPEPPSQPEIPEPSVPEPFVPEPSFPEVPVIAPEATAASDAYAGAFHAGSDDVTITVPRSEMAELGIPQRYDEDDVTIVGLPLPGIEVESSQRPTVELPAISADAIPPGLTRDTQELVSGAPKSSEPAAERPRSLSKITMHSSPPPPPLPPPPASAVDESEPASGGRRVRSATIHGLPPPELKTRTGATKRMGPPSTESLLDADEGDEVEIISLARPIMPVTARGRIALEDEDWVAPGSQLASDSQQGAIDAVIDAVVAGDADVSTLREHGDAALLRLVAQFPGPLEVLRRDLRALPPPSAHGPLIRTVIAVGASVVPHLIDLYEHQDPDVRFYAAFVFHELRDPRCMRPLAKLAYDANGDVRVVSMRVLETYRRHDGFEAAAAIVREQLVGDGRAQQLHAARAAGTLRDIGAIAQLIELLASTDRFTQEAALESLCSITGQQHGLKPHRWRAWYDEHGHRHRVEWIIDSLRHRDLPVRRWAADELVRITGHRVPFSPMGDKRARDVAAKAWTDWWEARGREMFGG